MRGPGRLLLLAGLLAVAVGAQGAEDGWTWHRGNMKWLRDNRDNLANAVDPGSSGLEDAARLLRTRGGAPLERTVEEACETYQRAGARLTKAGKSAGLLFSTSGNVGGILGAAAGRDAIGVWQEAHNWLLQDGAAWAGGALGTKGGVVLGGLIGGPPGALVGGAVGAAGGALAGSFAYGWYGKPRVDQFADDVVSAGRSNTSFDQTADPGRTYERLLAVVLEAEQKLKTHDLEGAEATGRRAQDQIERVRGVLNAGGLAKEGRELNARALEVRGTVAKAREAVKVAAAALAYNGSDRRAVWIRALEGRDLLLTAGREDLVKQLNGALDSLLAAPRPPLKRKTLPDLLSLKGKDVSRMAEADVSVTLNFATGLVEGFFTDRWTIDPWQRVFTGSFRGTYRGSREEGEFSGTSDASMSMNLSGKSGDRFSTPLKVVVRGTLKGRTLTVGIDDAGKEPTVRGYGRFEIAIPEPP